MPPSFLLSLALAAAQPAPAQTAPPLALASPVEKDVQCLVFFMMAAGTEKDPKRLQAATAGTWYFVGRLDISSPGLDLERALRQELAAMEGKPEVKDLAAACDAQFGKRGGELVDIGHRLQGGNP